MGGGGGVGIRAQARPEAKAVEEMEFEMQMDVADLTVFFPCRNPPWDEVAVVMLNYDVLGCRLTH